MGRKRDEEIRMHKTIQLIAAFWLCLGLVLLYLSLQNGDTYISNQAGLEIISKSPPGPTPSSIKKEKSSFTICPLGTRGINNTQHIPWITMNTDKMKTSIGLVEQSCLSDFQKNGKMETNIGFGRKPGPFDVLFTFEKHWITDTLKIAMYIREE